MNGFINVLKPTAMSSHDVVNRLRRILMMKKIGHGGTLDPNAAGVLPVCVGKGTKLSELLMTGDKTYLFKLRLGIKTDTGDIYGQLLEEKPVTLAYSQNAIEQALLQLTGSIWQKPPIYSALKMNGKKLYEYARKNQWVDIPKRNVMVYALTLKHYCRNELLIEAKVSKGTYIRTLCEDIAQALGTIGTMSMLIRTEAKNLSIDTSYTLEEISNEFLLGDNRFLLQYDQVFPWEKVMLEDNLIERLLHGQVVSLNDIGMNPIEHFFIVDKKHTIIGTGLIKENQGVKIDKRLF